MLDYLLSFYSWEQVMPVLGALVLGSLLVYHISSTKSSLPLINPQTRFDLTASKAKIRFVNDATSLLKAGYAKSDAFRLTCDNGVRLVLSQKYLNEIRSHPSLSFARLMQNEVHAHIPGFEPFSQFTMNNDIFLDTIRIKLTRALGKITKPLSDEAAIALKNNWTDEPDWHDLVLKASIERIIAQLSCKVFLGNELCQNEEWLRVTADYTGHVLRASETLRLWPEIVRPIVALFLESTRKVKREVQEARSIITPVLEKRQRSKEAAVKEGRVPEINDNATQWMEEIAKGRPYDPAIMQLAFATVAIITSSDMLTQAIFDLCGKEALVQELRDEIVAVMRQEGLKKTALYKLQLMDSFLKESQRMKPLSLATFRRMSTDNIRLQDGTEIVKGTSLMISNDSMRDPAFYENPDTFDPYRFVKLRQVSGREHSAHLVAASPEHMGFGYGNHACPGRFFAANEVKIALCHMLLKYEFKLADGTAPQIRKYGIGMQADCMAKLAVRRRREEICLEDLAD